MSSRRHGGGRVCVMATLFVLLFGCFAMCVQCRSTLLKDGGEAKSYPRNSHHLATTQCPSSSTVANSTSLADESKKIRVVMCVYKGLQCVEGEPCFCCALEQPEPQCYCTHDECVAKCPFCYPPPCSSETAVEEEGRALEAGTNATLQW